MLITNITCGRNKGILMLLLIKAIPQGFSSTSGNKSLGQLGSQLISLAVF